MDESRLQANIEALREFVQNKGWTVVDEKEIQSGYQLTVTDGITKIPVAFFRSGKALIQGKPGELQTRLKSWWNEKRLHRCNQQWQRLPSRHSLKRLQLPP